MIQYAGNFYKVEDGKYFVARGVKKVVEWETDSMRTLEVFEPSTFIPARKSDIPLSVRKELQRMIEEEEAKEQAALEQRKAYEKKLEGFKEERIGSGNYVCSVCGHKQTHKGECEYCGDGICR